MYYLLGDLTVINTAARTDRKFTGELTCCASSGNYLRNQPCLKVPHSSTALFIIFLLYRPTTILLAFLVTPPQLYPPIWCLSRLPLIHLKSRPSELHLLIGISIFSSMSWAYLRMWSTTFLFISMRSVLRNYWLYIFVSLKRGPPPSPVSVG